jgi:hypothetical protein
MSGDELRDAWGAGRDGQHVDRPGRFEPGGVRFRLFPQSPVLPAFAEPETVVIRRPPGGIGPGPSDERMYVADALDKSEPYAFPYLPPFAGPVHPPARPGPDGHFDHFEVGTREFNAAHMYGTIRLVLDIWEDYFDGPIDWHFADHFSRLELIPNLDWNNAQSGYGFIETGFGFDEDYGDHPFALNFDILSHELGHSILFAVVGAPPVERVTATYRAFQEAGSDIVTLLSTLHFRSVIDQVLAETSGNIYFPNELNRFAETSPTHQIRDASNSLRMSDVPDVNTPQDQLSEPDIHEIGEPLTGAVFDVLTELFQTILVQRGLISPELNALSRRVEEGEPVDEEFIQDSFDAAIEGRFEAFARALTDARDIVGTLTAGAFAQLAPDLTFAQVYQAYLHADQEITGGDLQDLITESFAWREIAPMREPRRLTGRIVRRSIIARTRHEIVRDYAPRYLA